MNPFSNNFSNTQNPQTQQITQPINQQQYNTPTFINSSTSISEPIKPFDGLDHQYTPEQYLQNIDARVTFSLGLQPLNPFEYKYWHARRMALIQCSLTGTALDWYINLHDTYKQEWNSFIQLFKKQFSSQKTAYYAQVEALALTKKENETVRHFALRVQQLVKKGWCNESPATINLKCNEIFTKGLPKKLKDFANRRQVKHTSTLLEPSIPFHTLIKHVDSEDIANERIRTNDLSLEINILSDKLDSTDIEDTEHINFVNRNPNNKSKPSFKKYCHYCHRTNLSISSCYIKKRDDEYNQSRYSRSKAPQQTFIQYFKEKPNKENNQETYNNYNYERNRDRSNSFGRSRQNFRNNSRNNRYNSRSNSRPRYSQYPSRSYSPYQPRSRYDNYQNQSRNYNQNYNSKSPNRNYNSNYKSQSPYRTYSRQRFRSRSQTPNSNFDRYNNPYRPPSRPRNDYNRSRSSSFTRQNPQRINKIEHNKKSHNTNFELNMYHPTETANAITPTSWFYQLYVHTPNQNLDTCSSRLEILFLLDTGASISVLNLPTYCDAIQKHENVETRFRY